MFLWLTTKLASSRLFAVHLFQTFAWRIPNLFIKTGPVKPENLTVGAIFTRRSTWGHFRFLWHWIIIGLRALSVSKFFTIFAKYFKVSNKSGISFWIWNEVENFSARRRRHFERGCWLSENHQKLLPLKGSE